MAKHVTPYPPNNPPNGNVLEGIRCPKCGSTSRFHIQATALFMDVTDDGTTDFCNMQWDQESEIICVHCKKTAAIADFTVYEDDDLGNAVTVDLSNMASLVEE
jgi:predicted nucleic-acid-binding Zn-ribbon protein